MNLARESHGIIRFFEVSISGWGVMGAMGEGQCTLKAEWISPG